MPSDLTIAEKAEKLGLEYWGRIGLTDLWRPKDRPEFGYPGYPSEQIAALYAERFPAPDYRAALTPTTDGEREARRVANEAGDADMDNIGHLRHTLTLLDNERLSHTDEVRRLDLEIDRLRTECIRRATDRDSARAEVAALTKQLNHKVTP